MKNKKILWVLLILALFVAFAGCKKDEDDNDSLSLLPMEPASSVQKFDGDVVANVKDAEDLFGEAMGHSNFRNLLKDADASAFDKAFKDAYGKAFADYMASYDDKAKEASISVNVNDTAELKKKDDVKAGSITGSTNTFLSTNLTYGDLFPYFGGSFSDALKNNGNSYSFSMSGSRTFAITDGYIKVKADPPGTATYSIAGYFTVEYDYVEDVTLKDKAKNIYTENGYETNRFSLTLSISDGTNGAKFRLSISEKDSDSGDFIREAAEGWNAITSGLEVYDNNNKLIYTIPDYDAPTWWAGEIIKGSF